MYMPDKRMKKLRKLDAFSPGICSTGRGKIKARMVCIKNGKRREREVEGGRGKKTRKTL